MGRIDSSNLKIIDGIDSPNSPQSSPELSPSFNSPTRSRSSSAVSFNSAVDTEDQDYHTRHCPGDVEIPNRVFVKGFGHETTEEELKSFFEIYGIVHDAKIVQDRNAGGSKGYAFISFDSQGIAEKVRKIGHVTYNDREIVIGPAKIRKKRPIFTSYTPPLSEYYPGCWQMIPSSPHQPGFNCLPSPTENGVSYYYYPTHAMPILPTPLSPTPQQQSHQHSRSCSPPTSLLQPSINGGYYPMLPQQQIQHPILQHPPESISREQWCVPQEPLVANHTVKGASGEEQQAHSIAALQQQQQHSNQQHHQQQHVPPRYLLSTQLSELHL